jgi:hypothetical protein
MTEVFAIESTTGTLCPVGTPVTVESNSLHVALMH